MKLRRIRIENFRGIKNATWQIRGNLIALIGAGDSTKTTILEALGLVLSPTHTTQFTDADFFRLNLDTDIVIEVVVTDLPDHLVKESQLGKDRAGVMLDGTLVHDPIDEAEECLIVRLTVTPALDPTWEVVRPESEFKRPISASQRRQLGFFRLGERHDFHLRWARGSALVSMTDDQDGASSIILDAHREARQAIFDSEPTVLHRTAARVQASAGNIGTADFDQLRPGLEPGSVSSAHALMLHDGEIPLSRMGLGTRRLTSLSIQEQAMTHGSIIAIDEIEHGLEPHRLAQVLYHLKKRTDEGSLQVIMTTHSPVVIKTLNATDFVVVSSNNTGETLCRNVPSDLNNIQGTFRGAPEALLGRRVLVGEGATEAGFLRGLIRHWDQERHRSGYPTAAAIGTVVTNGGGGSQSIQRAMNFHELGYQTAILLDNDDPIVNSHVAKTREQGICVFQWATENDLEMEIIKTLPINGLQELVRLAVEIKSDASICDSVGARLGNKRLFGTNVSDWISQADTSEPVLREAIAAAAVAKGDEWFKREDRGEDLALVVVAHWDGAEESHMMEVISELENFIYKQEVDLTPENEGSSAIV